MQTIRRNIFTRLAAPLCAALFFLSCSDEELRRPLSLPILIDLQTPGAPATKAESIDNAEDLADKKFGFYAVNLSKKANLVDSYADVTKENSKITATLNGATKYWPINPAERIKFFSWFPHEDTGKPIFDNTAGSMTLKHQVVADAASQQDVMVAITTSTEQTHGDPVAVHFYHTLTKISFSFKKANSGMKDIPLKKVELQQVNTEGTFTISDIPAFTSGNLPEFPWSSTSRSNVSYTYPEGTNVTSTDNTKNPSGEAFLLLPDASFADNSQIVITLYDGLQETFPLKEITIMPNWKSGDHIHYIVTIKNPGCEVVPTVIPWTEEQYNWNIEQRFLNISKSSVEINQMNGARITFSSNMPYIWIKNEAYVGQTGTSATTPTNRHLSGLVSDEENEPALFHYDYDPVTRIGTGYIDLLSQGQENLIIGSNYHRITLCAGYEKKNNTNALQREITVNTNNVGWKFTPSSLVNTVGVFFRNGEKGERIVSNVDRITRGSFTEETKWMAEVTAGSGWIEITNTPSFDPLIGSDASKGNAERYLVTDGSTTARGKGRIYFRVGSKETRANTASPRYGVIKVKVYNNDGSENTSATQTIYVRQGETDDFLMRKSDAIPAGVMAGQERTLAKKIAAFNLTAPSYKSDPSNGNTVKLPAQSSMTTTDYFTEYPSQVGAYTTWALHADYSAMRRQLYPSGNSPATVSSWPGQMQAHQLTFWGNNDTNFEVCPPGYRLPTDGPTTTRPTLTNMENLIGVEQSELRQSLFLSPPKGTYSSVSTESYVQAGTLNAQFGVYADGFSDRMARAGNNNEYRRVGYNDRSAAGILFYNPNNDASIFFPGGGNRNTSGTVTQNNTGSYWTSTMGPDLSSRNGGSYLRVQNKAWSSTPAMDVAILMDNNNMGYSIRCIRINDN